MKVIIAHKVRAKEFSEGQIPAEDLECILSSFAEGIYTPIKGEALPKGSRLMKIYVTTIQGAKRIVFLVDVQTGTGYFLFYRNKNDSLGKNISIKNPAFKKRLLQYLDYLDADINAGLYTVHDL